MRLENKLMEAIFYLHHTTIRLVQCWIHTKSIIELPFLVEPYQESSICSWGYKTREQNYGLTFINYTLRTIEWKRKLTTVKRKKRNKISRLHRGEHSNCWTCFSSVINHQITFQNNIIYHILTHRVIFEFKIQITYIYYAFQNDVSHW